jgi:hypothetical protein
LEIVALKNFDKDEEFLITYGYKTNLNLMVNYGFLIPSNPLDFVYALDILYTQVPSDTQATEFLQEKLEIALNHLDDRTLVLTNNGPSKELMIAVRIRSLATRKVVTDGTAVQKILKGIPLKYVKIF